MNMKTLSVILILGSSVSAFAGSLEQFESGNERPVSYGGTMSYVDSQRNVPPPVVPQPGNTSAAATVSGTVAASANPYPAGTAENKAYDEKNAYTSFAASNKSKVFKCDDIVEKYDAISLPAFKPTDNSAKPYLQCSVLQKLSPDGSVEPADRNAQKMSADGKIRCQKLASFTRDFEKCVQALKWYDGVVVAEQAMMLEQKVRTDVNIQQNQKKAQEEMAKGASQTAIYDGAIASNSHMKSIQTEKMVAYGAAVGALYNASRIFPKADAIKSECQGQDLCGATVEKYKSTIIANEEAKTLIQKAAIEYFAKAAAAGIEMGKYKDANRQLEQVRASITDDQTDLMMEQCVINPTDPACAKNRNRVAGQSIAGGDFGMGTDGAGNTFNMNPESEVIPEMGVDGALDEGAPVSGINSPFVDDAKVAKGILDPAAAAQMQASGGAQGGGGGGGSGGGGGGGASLGSDLNGANKDGDKEAQIKTNKVSGAYSQGGGGGYKGVGKGKDDANPFASLFDAKGSGGGVEEDRSIASGDIDGAASGLFQKISKRYSQIQADKRIEAKNLE